MEQQSDPLAEGHSKSEPSPQKSHDNSKPKSKKLDISLPYLAAPGGIKTALERIRAASTPERVTQDFVATKLQMKGGQGGAITAFLKKIGFVASDGTPTALYRNFRNPDTGGTAIAQAIKHAYKALSSVNEYFYELDDAKLRGVIVQVTGSETDSASTRLIVSTLKYLKEFADFNAGAGEESSLAKVGPRSDTDDDEKRERIDGQIGLNLAYTINLNLPATSDQAVFNAIFRSLKEHLLSNG